MASYPLSTLTLLVLTELSCISAIAAPSSYRRLHFFPVAFLVYLQLRVVDINGETPIDTYAVALRSLFLFYTAVDYVLIRDAPRELRLIGDKTDITKASFMQRQVWAFKLLFSPRNIGWSHEDPAHLPPRPTCASRLGFLVSRLKLWTTYLLMHDANLTLIRMNPNFKDVPPIFDSRVLTNPWHMFWRVHLGVGLLVAIFVAQELLVLVAGVVWVSLGLSEFKEWPWAFGSFYDAYSVRTFWSKAWHQMFRRMFVTPADVIAKAIRLPRTGAFQRYFKIFLVFALSGIWHQIADGVQVGDWMAPNIIYYFLVQPPMIMLEDAVIATGKRAGIKGSRWTKLLGYVYVVAWFSFIAPLWVKTEGPVGHFDHRMEWSLVEGFWRGNWKPYDRVRR